MIRTTFANVAVGQIFASCSSGKPYGRFIRMTGDEDYNVVCLDDGTRRQFAPSTSVAVGERREKKDRRAEDRALRTALESAKDFSNGGADS